MASCQNVSADIIQVVTEIQRLILRVKIQSDVDLRNLQERLDQLKQQRQLLVQRSQQQNATPCSGRRASNTPPNSNSGRGGGNIPQMNQTYTHDPGGQYSPIIPPPPQNTPVGPRNLKFGAKKDLNLSNSPVIPPPPYNTPAQVQMNETYTVSDPGAFNSPGSPGIIPPSPTGTLDSYFSYSRPPTPASLGPSVPLYPVGSSSPQQAPISETRSGRQNKYSPCSPIIPYDVNRTVDTNNSNPSRSATYTVENERSPPNVFTDNLPGCSCGTGFGFQEVNCPDCHSRLGIIFQIVHLDN